LALFVYKLAAAGIELAALLEVKLILRQSLEPHFLS